MDARALDAERAAGVVLTRENYDVSARDPFGRPSVSVDVDRLWAEALELDRTDLLALRSLVQRNNSLEVASLALGEALRRT